MGECGNDFDCCNKYKPKRCLIERLIEYGVVIILGLTIAFLTTALFNPHYFM